MSHWSKVRRLSGLAMGTIIAFAQLADAAAQDAPVQIGPYSVTTFEASRFSQEPTECDLLASHGSDPFKVAVGLSQSQIDFARAVPACESALAADPDNPRLNYLMLRVLTYMGETEKAAPFRYASANSGYPQALFVVGYLHVTEAVEPKDACLGAKLIGLSARVGRFAGQVAYPSYTLDGTFAGCDVPMDDQTLAAMLADAEQNPAGKGYLDKLLVKSLKREVAARAASATN